MAPLLEDVRSAVRICWAASSTQIVRNYVYVPIGVIVLMAAVFGVRELIGMSGVTFPASVACMLAVLAILLLSQRLLGRMWTQWLVNVFDFPAAWSLRYMSLFFTPSFVVLPLSPSIGAVQVGKIAAVFVIGFILGMLITTYMVVLLGRVLGMQKPRPAADDETTELRPLQSDPLELSASTSLADESQADLARDVSSAAELPRPDSVAEPARIRGPGHAPDTMSQLGLDTAWEAPPQVKPKRDERLAAVLTQNFDLFVYAALLVCVGIPVIAATGYAMPVDLAVNILAFLAIQRLPRSVLRVLHPTLATAFVTSLFIFILSRVRLYSYPRALHDYSTGSRYYNLITGAASTKPGAGDVLISILDVAIVALALPCFTYRNELLRHFWIVVIPSCVISAASFFLYPYICHLIGIDAKLSLAFAPRSVTLALAQLVNENLQGDSSLVNVTAILSGVVGVLCEPFYFRMLKIVKEDFITRGVVLGVNASALATAALLPVDPRAAAMSCVSFVLFGLVMVVLSVIPPVVEAVHALVRT